MNIDDLCIDIRVEGERLKVELYYYNEGVRVDISSSSVHISQIAYAIIKGVKRELDER